MEPLQPDANLNDPPKTRLGKRIQRLNEHHGWKFFIAVAGLAGIGFGIWQYWVTDVRQDVAVVLNPETAKLHEDNAKIEAAIEKARADILQDNERHRPPPTSPNTMPPAPPSADARVIAKAAPSIPSAEPHRTGSGVAPVASHLPLANTGSAQHATPASAPRFTAETPAAIIAPQGDTQYQDRIAAVSLRDILSKRLHLRADTTNPQLIVEVSDVDVRKDITGQPCPEPGRAAFSSLTASARLTIRMVWANGTVELSPQLFSDAVPTCDPSQDDVTHNLAFDHVIASARDKILAMAATNASVQ